ncbi:MAG TPA: caspase family protein [Thermoanaerobaculia bacterium]
MILLLLLSCGKGVPATTQAQPTKPEPVVPLPRRALLIGIDDYSAVGLRPQSDQQPAAGRAWPALRGATRDVDLLREMLIARYGFEPKSILTLKNQQATRDGIIRAIENHLIEPAAKDDVVLFYFAGHGSQVENSLSSELDRLDESIVPADSKLGAPDIRDKELAVLFNRMLDRNVRLTVMFDSCHSGSASRALSADAASRVIATDSRDARDASEPAAPETRGALVMSASKDFARAFETVAEDGKYHGVFSWALLRAMRDAVRDEPAADTFLRIQAMMRSDSPYQDPVFGGTEAMQSLPLFSAGQAAPSRMSIAIESVKPDGTIVLGGGWAHGLTVGSVLQPRRGGVSAQIRIIGMLGLGRSEGRFVHSGMRSSRNSAGSGELLDVVTWAAPRGRTLRIWMPQSSESDEAVAFARQVRSEARAARVHWVDDPTKTTPDHVLRWRDASWELLDGRRNRQEVTSSTFVRTLPARSTLFVQLPAPVALPTAIAVGPGTDYDNIEPVSDPARADYILTGRLTDAAVDYAWIRPEVHQDDARNTALPPRTDWFAAEPLDDASIVLRRAILRLNAILGWLHLSAPADVASPYRLALHDDEKNTEVVDKIVRGGQRYKLRLHAKSPGTTVERRHYYVFGIDSYGRSVLLFPLRGSVENCFPVERDGAAAAPVIDVGGLRITEPYGLDTYFLISTDESLPNPRVLESSGVRTRGPHGGTALEELLSRTGGSSRASESVGVPPLWSIDRLFIRSVPAK